LSQLAEFKLRHYPKLGLRYWGCDLSAKQVRANKGQGAALCPDNAPEWVCGCSRETLVTQAPEADLFFSCPPYGDLEQYSDSPFDLSAMPYEEFVTAYADIIAKGCRKLKPNRFACFVVGDFRDDHGAYRNFPGLTAEIFLAQGLSLYNEAILVTACGSLPVRVSSQFPSGRKLGKTHQNVLCFWKGNSGTACETIKTWGAG